MYDSLVRPRMLKIAELSVLLTINYMQTYAPTTPVIRQSEENKSGIGVFVGILITLVLLAVFFLFAWPAIRYNSTEQSIPAAGSQNSSVRGEEYAPGIEYNIAPEQPQSNIVPNPGL